jgi:hypothetical protein
MFNPIKLNFMQIAHIVSDSLLALVGLFIFFKYISKLTLSTTILWESFVLSIVMAAIFGALGFAEWGFGTKISLFFQHLAGSVGAIGLVVAAFSLALGRSIPQWVSNAILIIGFFLFAVSEGFNKPILIKHIPTVAMSLVALAGILAMIKNRKTEGLGLIAGVVFAAIGTFRSSFISDTDLSIDFYHAMMALSIVCFGLAVRKQVKNNQI